MFKVVCNRKKHTLTKTFGSVQKAGDFVQKMRGLGWSIEVWQGEEFVLAI